MTKAERRALKATNHSGESTVITVLKKVIKDIQTKCDLDPERMQSSMVSAMTDKEYGAVNGLVNIIVAKAMFPADRGDYGNLANNQVIVSEMLDIHLLNKVKQARGFHSFADDSGKVIVGQKPNYEDYEDYTNIFIAELAKAHKIDLPEDFDVQLLVTDEAWNKTEATRLELAREESETIKSAVAANKELMKQLANA